MNQIDIQGTTVILNFIGVSDV